MSYFSVLFKIIGGQAYTQDNIIIKNIVATLYNISNTTKEETLKHFKEFGEVSSYQWLKETEPKKCLISFCDSKVAAIVLQKYGNFTRPFYVQACESWQQPDGEHIIKVLTELAETHDSSSTTDPDDKASILTLNDDCLECICKNLGTLADQINFALACQRFSGILRLLSRAKYRQLNADIFSYKKLTTFQVKIFLLIVGPQVKILLASRYLKESCEFEMLGPYYPNVEKLNIHAVYMAPETLMLLIGKMKFLKELWLINCSTVTIKGLESLTNLKKLHIQDIEYTVLPNALTGENISNLCGLEELSLPNIEPCHFKEICKILTNLNYLDITDCFLLKTDDFEHILQHLLRLETLKLSSTGENFNCIAQLPKLKQLSIIQYDIPSITDDFLQNLAKHQAHQLQELMLDCTSAMTGRYIFDFCFLERLSLCNCWNIEPCHFKEIFKNLTNLNYLDITGCTQLKTDDFEHILQHLLRLETLILSTTRESFNCIAQLPKLKKLSIIGYETPSITEAFLQNLSKHQAHQLQELMLYNISGMTAANASLVSDLKNLKVFSCRDSAYNVSTCFLQILEGCLKLESLDLRECRLEVPDFLRSARKILQKQRFSGLRRNCVHIMLTAGRSLVMMLDDIIPEDAQAVLDLTIEIEEDEDDFSD